METLKSSELWVGGVIWQRIFKWNKYYLYSRRKIGYYSSSLTEQEIKDKNPNVKNFEFINTGYGTIEVYGQPAEFDGLVNSDNEYEYPHNGQRGNFYYELIN